MRSNADKKILWEIAYTILLFPILGENILSTVLGDAISKLLSVLTCLVILGMVFMKHKLRITKFLMVLLMSVLLRMLITFVWKDTATEIDASNSIITPYGLMGYTMLCIFLDLYMENKSRLRVVFRSIVIILTISVFANFFFTGELKIADNVAVFREAINTGYTNSRTWLFGHRNAIFIHHLMWMLFSYFSCKLDNRDAKTVFIFQMLFTMLVGIVSWNSTMMLVTAVLFVLYLFKDTLWAKLNIWHYILIYFCLEIGIVFFRIQDLFSFIIVGILHRNLSFTGRTVIWNHYIKQFKDAGIMNKLLGNFGVSNFQVNSHNMFLGLLVFSGIIGVLLFCAALLFSAVNLYKEKVSDNAKVISIIVFGYLINALTMEFYLQPLTALYLGYHIKSLNSHMNPDNEEQREG